MSEIGARWTLAELIAAIAPPEDHTKEAIATASEMAAEHARSVVTETEPYERKRAWLRIGWAERNRILKVI